MGELVSSDGEMYPTARVLSLAVSCGLNQVFFHGSTGPIPATVKGQQGFGHFREIQTVDIQYRFGQIGMAPILEKLFDVLTPCHEMFLQRFKESKVPQTADKPIEFAIFCSGFCLLRTPCLKRFEHPTGCTRCRHEFGDVAGR